MPERCWRLVAQAGILVGEEMQDSAVKLSDGEGQAGRLGSWKEIAAYLRAGVRSVQRWEETEQLPVHRHAHDKRSTVYAFKRELDEWYEGRRNTLVQEKAGGEESDFLIGSSGESGGTLDVAAVDDVEAAENVPRETYNTTPFGFVKPTRFGNGAMILALAAAVVVVVLVLPSRRPAAYSLRLSVLAPKGSAFAFGTDLGGNYLS